MSRASTGLTLDDRTDLYAAHLVIDNELGPMLDDWHSDDQTAPWKPGSTGGFSTAPVDVDRMHALARELVRHLAAVRRRHAKRLEARERRGSPLEG